MADREAVQSQYVNTAAKRGLTYSVATLGASSGAVWLAHTHIPRFRTSLGVSGKVALAISPAFAVFNLLSELTLSDARKRPWAYDLPDAEGNRTFAPPELQRRNVVAELGPHHRAANYVYDHPYYMLAGIGVPTVGGLFYSQAGHEHLKLSQKIMHTRVWGQGCVLGALMSLMFFRDYMERNGRYQVDEDRAAEQEYRARGAEWEAQELIREAKALYGR